MTIRVPALDQLIDSEIFIIMIEARALIESQRKEHGGMRNEQVMWFMED